MLLFLNSLFHVIMFLIWEIIMFLIIWEIPYSLDSFKCEQYANLGVGSSILSSKLFELLFFCKFSWFKWTWWEHWFLTDWKRSWERDSIHVIASMVSYKAFLKLVKIFWFSSIYFPSFFPHFIRNLDPELHCSLRNTS